MTVLDDIPVLDFSLQLLTGNVAALNFYRCRNRLSIALAKGFLVRLPAAIILSVILGTSCGTLHACRHEGARSWRFLEKETLAPIQTLKWIEKAERRCFANSNRDDEKLTCSARKGIT
ncbi:MAG: hypothetical protein K0R44_3808 [Thermomicrobiales bacterium]|nr:hypothetical protein [Thermomicrobiales bacterium]